MVFELRERRQGQRVVMRQELEDAARRVVIETSEAWIRTRWKDEGQSRGPGTCG